MQPSANTMKGFLFGLLTALLLVVILGAVDHQTSNRVGDTTTDFKSVYASSDGKIVYVCDNNRVYRSIDGGENWSVVLVKTDQKL